jgi:CubicO group peptidase (beta-lactamase class C family)
MPGLIPRSGRRLALAVLCAASLWGCRAVDEGSTPTPTEVRARVDCEPAFAPASDLLRDAVRDLALPGGALLLAVEGDIVCEAYYGAYDERTAVPIASAAKWLSAATILTLVDEGALALDDPISDHLPYFEGERGAITIRQILSHTSGLPAYSDCMFDKRLTLEACVQEIATLDLLAPPGTGFHYGGASYSVAGRVAEVAGDMSWGALFRARVVGPLGLDATDYGSTRNPMLSEGYVVSSLRDYGTFLQMVLSGGTLGSRRVLSPASVAEMLRDQTAGLDLPVEESDTAYGLGVWLERKDGAGRAGQASSPGRGGFVPWLDLERDLLGVFMVVDEADRVWETALAVQQAARDAVDDPVTR